MSSEIIDRVNEIITQSGNTFHCQVLKYLQDKGWSVLISPYYNDNVSNKPREIDLIAEKPFASKDRYQRDAGTVNVRLFIECKYIPQITVFWFHNKDKHEAEELVTRVSSLTKNNIYTSQHHYLDNINRVAKLFSDERKKSAENEIFYKALNQSLNAMVYYRNRGSIIKPLRGYVKQIHYTLNYPVIMCNSFENLYRVEIDDDSDASKIKENFQLEVNYAYMSSSGSDLNEYFIIDIVDFTRLDEFLGKVEKDADIIHFMSDQPENQYERKKTIFNYEK